MTETERRRRFTRACVIGAVPALLLVFWMVTGGLRVATWQPTSDVYDAQARTLLDGSFAMPRQVLGMEAFLIGDNAYMYQGPTPALSRLPVVAIFGDDLDGHVAPYAIFLAFVLVVIFGSRLHWRARQAVRGDADVTTAEGVVVSAITFVLFGGSILVFIASRTYVFHESVMWGLAFTLITFDAVVALLQRWRLPVLAAASAAVTLALCSRASLGLGAITALGLVAIGELVQWVRDRRAAREPDPPDGGIAGADATEVPASPSLRRFGMAVLACAAPLVVYCGINVVKFGTPVSVPWDRQQYSTVVKVRRQFLAETNNSFFGAKFVPTTTLDYLRPDGIRFTGLFPWVAAPLDRDVVGDVNFDTIEPTTSVPASAPLLVALSAIGVVVLIRGRRARPALSRLWVPVAGALTCGLAIFPFGYIAQRYVADLFPLLLLLGAIGVHALGKRMSARERTRWTRPTIAGLVVLGTFGVWVNVAIGLDYQRLGGANIDEDVVAGYVGFREDVASLYTDDSLITLRRGSSLPRLARAGEYFVVGDCDGLYYADGTKPNETVTSWKPVERTNATGRYLFDVTFPDRPAGTVEPLLVNGTREAPNLLTVEYLGDDKIQFRYTGKGLDRVPRAIEIEPGRRYRMDLAADPGLDLLEVRIDDRIVTSAIYTPDADNTVIGRRRLGVATEPRFTGTLRSKPLSRDLCRTLRERSTR